MSSTSRLLSSIPQLFSTPWASRVVAFLGVVLAFVRLWGFAMTQTSIMDEGEYLLKGYLFVTGRYWPFQDYGVWTNQMPLAFLIPGMVQKVFGVGLLTGRGYALFLNALALLGLWIVARRFGKSTLPDPQPSTSEALRSGSYQSSHRIRGEWLAAGAIWAYALNTATLKMYSTATSQVLITCMLVWVLVLIAGEKRPFWQVVGAGVLSGIMLMTRLNLAPALPFIAGYIFWQHGRRAGMWATAGMGIVILAGHAVFWPGILRAWAAWVPPSLGPFLAPFRPPDGLPFWNPSMENASRVLSFLFSVRYHFVAYLGLLTMGLLGPKEWKRTGHFRLVILLAGLFFVLLAAHAWASLGIHSHTDNALGNDYCVFCFPVYTSFFSILAILLMVLLLTAWPWEMNRLQSALAVGVILMLAAGIGYGAFQAIGETVVRWRIPRLWSLLRGEPTPGIPLWDFLQVRLGMGFELSKRVVPVALGVLVAGAVLLLACVQRQLAQRNNLRVAYGSLALVFFLAVGLVFSPTIVLGGGYTNYDCSGDVVAAYETAGEQLAALIPPNSNVYWQGNLSSAPLLYLDSPNILPGQINLDYTLRLSGSDDEHLRFGFWTDTLAQDWLAQADYALVAERYYKGWLAEELQTSSFQELPHTVPLAPCQERSYLRIFQRVK